MYSELKNRFKEEFFKGEKSERNALEKAYADMSRRAQGHKPQMKEDCIEWLLNEKVFEKVKSCKSQKEFDEWHKETCEGLKNIWGSFGTIGRSQKVINMAFKYLSCVGDNYDNILKFCHMTLDGYTLNWYKTIVSKEEKKKLTEWSKIKDYDNEYYQIQDRIRKELKKGFEYSIRIGCSETKKIAIPETPFEAEFIIWEGEIINYKYNELVKKLNKYKQEGLKNDEWLIEHIFDDYLKSVSE